MLTTVTRLERKRTPARLRHFAFVILAMLPTMVTAGPIHLDASGDVSGVTDRTSIQAAIEEAKMQGPGTQIMLGKGVFYLDRTLEFKNAPVTLRGQGIGNTVITNAPGVIFGDEPGSPFIWFYLDSTWDAAETCDVEVSHLSLRAVGPTGHTYNGYDAWLDGIRVTGKPAGSPDESATYNARFHQLEVAGEPGEDYWWFSNVRSGLDMYHESWEFALEVDSEVSNSRFEGTAIGISQFTVVNSDVRIINSSISTEYWNAIDFYDASNSTFEIMGNHIAGYGRVLIYNGWAWGVAEIGEIPQLSTYLISNNSIESIGTFPLDIRDLASHNSGIPGSASTMHVTLTRNTVLAQDVAQRITGAILLLAVDDSRITDNTITGNTVAPGPQSGHVGIGNPLVVTGDRNIVGRNDSSGFAKHPDSPYDVLLWNDARTFVDGVAEGNLVFSSGPVLDETDDPATPEYDGLNTIDP